MSEKTFKIVGNDISDGYHTFDELIEYGKAHNANMVDGMPWSFEINGRAITHENNDCYLITTLEGVMKFKRGEMLIIGVNGEAYPCKMDIFEKTYEPVKERPHPNGECLDRQSSIFCSECEKAISEKV